MRHSLVVAQREWWLVICLVALLTGIGAPALTLRADSTTREPSFILQATPLHDGSTSLLTVVLADAPAGLQATDLRIDLETTGIIQIIGKERLGNWPMQALNQTTTSVQVHIVDLFDAIRPGAHQVPLLQLRLQAMIAGQTSATLTVERFQDDKGGEAPVSSFSTTLSFNPQVTQEELPIMVAGDLALEVGDKAQTALTLAQAPQGLQSADLILSVEDPAIARFSDVTPGVLDGDAFMVLERSASSIHLRLLDLLRNRIQAGAHDQDLVKLTVEGLQMGQTRLLINVVAFVDDQGNTVTPQISPGRIDVSIAIAPGPPPQPPAPQPAPPPPQGVALFLSGKSNLSPQAEGLADITLTEAPQGLQRYDLVLRVSDPTVVRIDALTTPELDPRFSEVVQSASDTMEIRAVDFNDVIQSGAKAIVLARVAFTTLQPGKTNFTIEAKVLTDDSGHPIQAPAQGFALTVTLPAIGNSMHVPQDLDGDGLYEDVNGDGRLTLADAIFFGFYYDSPEVQKYSRYYDFNHDGRVDFADVVRLLQMVLQHSGI